MPIPASKFVKSIKSLFLRNRIPLVCCYFRCTFSFYNAFMCTVSAKAVQRELNDIRTHERMNSWTHGRKDAPSRDLLNCIDSACFDIEMRVV